jgi:WXG100 family type VII secretion target
MLDHAAKVATETGEGIALNLTRLLNEIESQSSAFQGAAGTTFLGVSHELGKELRNILEALNTMANGVNVSNRTFGNTDQDASNEISQVVGQYAPGAGSVANALRG